MKHHDMLRQVLRSAELRVERAELATIFDASSDAHEDATQIVATSWEGAMVEAGRRFGVDAPIYVWVTGHPTPYLVREISGRLKWRGA